MSDETNLNDLLQLNLHNFEDEVRGIVDKATKELNMEKVGHWDVLSFTCNSVCRYDGEHGDKSPCLAFLFRFNIISA